MGEHSREIVVEEAEREMSRVLRDIRKSYELTLIEYHQFLVTEMARTLKYRLRYERHGNGEKEAGLE
jgi:hypothetical protein